jgi:hypothetical protein
VTYNVPQRQRRFYIERQPATTAGYWGVLLAEDGKLLTAEVGGHLIYFGGDGPGLAFYVRQRPRAFPVEEE